MNTNNEIRKGKYLGWSTGCTFIEICPFLNKISKGYEYIRWNINWFNLYAFATSGEATTFTPVDILSSVNCGVSKTFLVWYSTPVSILRYQNTQT